VPDETAARGLPGTRAIGDKLASGSAWTREEITKGLQALGDGIEALGKKISH
jgi:hypothetical protein